MLNYYGNLKETNPAEHTACCIEDSIVAWGNRKLDETDPGQTGNRRKVKAMLTRAYELLTESMADYPESRVKEAMRTVRNNF